SGRGAGPKGIRLRWNKTFRNLLEPQIVLGSTPTVKGVSRIEKAWLEAISAATSCPSSLR
ncbi:hypothetical protein, partial [Escherichia coli]|uniref:hypothetical protein n=1 Tax=Escherichia coli TaxID=562 RepID=UPI0039A60085